LKAASRKTLAAALTLGAAVFAWPVQALQCLDARDMGVNPKRPYSQIADLIIQLGKEKVSKAQAVFRGRLISAAPLRQSDNSDFQDFILTYKVLEWKKGRGGSHAKLLHTVWCFGECNSSEITAQFMQRTEEKVYIAGPHSVTDDKKIPKDLNGEVDICSDRDSMRLIGAELLRGDHLNHRRFLFLLSTTEALE
jgi:hypothetical protein